MNMRLVVGTASLAGAAILVSTFTALAGQRSNSQTASTPTTSKVVVSTPIGDTGETTASNNDGGIAVVGPDVIVGDLTGPSSYSTGTGPISGIVRYALGTTSCNIGTVPLHWYDFGTGTPTEHPVISQNLFRLKNGRFEHIGQAWLKHGFCALQQQICAACTPFCGGCCDELGVGCSDPYTSDRNGNPGGVGPKSQIRSSTGEILVWPYSQPASTNTFANNNGQLHAFAADVDPTQNVGAIYLSEGQYIAHDDALALNDNNNASYRRITFINSLGFPANYAGATVRMKTGVEGWKDLDPNVTIVFNDAADGRFILGYKASDNGNGTWHYEYGIQNLNSDRAGKSFVVPVPGCVTVTNMQFHDVDYHSGDGVTLGINYDGTNWAQTRDATSCKWNMSNAIPISNSNALRWATMYTVRFDANAGPTAVNATMDIFKAGAPTSITFATMGPTGTNPPACPSDANHNGSTDIDDLLLVINNWGVGPMGDVAPPCGNGLVDIDDLLVVINGWGPCP